MLREQIGRRIKELRRYRGLFQDTFAEQCEVSQGYLSKIERGQKEVSLARLEKFAEVLNCDLIVEFKVKETL